MDFIGNIKKLAEKALSQKDLLDTEEATKTALIMPFIQELGYNVFDPQEVRPEYTADIGTKKGEKVDYAIFRDGSPAILFECKALGIALDSSHRDQLFRYLALLHESYLGYHGRMLFFVQLIFSTRYDWGLPRWIIRLRMAQPKRLSTCWLAQLRAFSLSPMRCL